MVPSAHIKKVLWKMAIPEKVKIILWLTFATSFMGESFGQKRLTNQYRLYSVWSKLGIYLSHSD